MSQTAFLYRFNKRIPDYIGKLENIESDWQILAEKFDLPVLVVKNKTNAVELSEYYTDEIFEMVRQRYIDDINNFKY